MAIRPNLNNVLLAKSKPEDKLTIDGNEYLKGFTFAIKPNNSVNIGIMPRDYDTNTKKTVITNGNYKKYIFEFKDISSYADLIVCDVYEDGKFEFESEFSLMLIEDLFTGSVDNTDVIKMGYNRIPSNNFKPCICELTTIMLGGCVCGGFERERGFKKAQKVFSKSLK